MALIMALITAGSNDHEENGTYPRHENALHLPNNHELDRIEIPNSTVRLLPAASVTLFPANRGLQWLQAWPERNFGGAKFGSWVRSRGAQSEQSRSRP